MIKSLYTYRANIISVYDGDTVTADVDYGCGIWRHKVKIRLYGINTPEVRGPERVRGLAVRDFVRSVIAVDPGILLCTYRDKNGKYGRLLGTIYLSPKCDDTLNPDFIDTCISINENEGDGLVNLNKYLVVAGMAEYKDY